MVKKINFILVLLLLLVSVGAVSAADNFNDTIASDDESILEELNLMTFQHLLMKKLLLLILTRLIQVIIIHILVVMERLLHP